MKMRWAWTLPVLSILALLDAHLACAQGYGAPAGYGAPGYGAPGYGAPGHGAPGYGGPAGGMPMMAPYMAAPAGYMAGPGQPGLLPDAYGAYGTAETGPMAPGPGPMGPDMGGGGACPYCGGMGCDNCSGGMGGGMGGHLANGLLGDVFGLVAPYPDGGCAAVRWYDFAVDFMSLRREDAGRRVNFASLGINGPIVLDSNDLDFDAESSFRFSAMFQVGPGSNLEFTYFGLFFWDDRAVATSANNDLFSAFSSFGLVGPGGFTETDNSDLQFIDYESSFDSFEVNFRQRWMAPNCRFQGSWLCGVRYFKLDEDFNYFTQSTANTIPADPILGTPAILPSLNNNINVHNNMTGAQIGGDLWMCVLPGLRVGAEGKAGVYGNRIAVENTIAVNTGAAPVVEDLVRNDVSFLGEVNLMATYRLNYNWTLRGGYQFLYVDGVALGPENFNPTAPVSLDPASTRVATVNDNGSVFYHGWFIGTEFMW